jgi:hypothetical protein
MTNTPWYRTVAAAGCAVLLATALAACSGDDDDSAAGGASTTTAAATTTTAPAPAAPIIFNGQGNDFDAYTATPPFTKQVVIHHHDEKTNPDGLDINAQICFDPHNPRRFVAGEDTLQDTVGHPGWGIFELSGSKVGALSAKEIGKLVPTYQTSNDNPENYGCGFLPDGRIITTDVGNQAVGDGDGQLIVWFPPFDAKPAGDSTKGVDWPPVKYCKVEVGLTTGQGALVRDDGVFVANARADSDHPAGVYKYPLDAFPTNDTPAGGCDGKDKTGAPMVKDNRGTVFVDPGKGNTVATPNAIAAGPDGHLFVTSVINGVIAEFTADGEYVRDVVKPKEGEKLSAQPFSVGTPLGLAVAPNGDIYYADIGIVISDSGVGPGNGTGTVRRVHFVDGEPQAPEVMDRGLAFPDGIGIWVPPAAP